MIDWMPVVDNNIKSLMSEMNDNKLTMMNSIELMINEEEKRLIRAVDISNGKLAPDMKLILESTTRGGQDLFPGEREETAGTR
jgi:hypothetical protein